MCDKNMLLPVHGVDDVHAPVPLPVQCPVLMLSSKAAPAANTMYDKNALRMLMVVEGWTKPLLEYSCSRILQPRKGDKLILAQVRAGVSEVWKVWGGSEGVLVWEVKAAEDSSKFASPGSQSQIMASKQRGSEQHVLCRSPANDEQG